MNMRFFVFGLGVGAIVLSALLLGVYRMEEKGTAPNNAPVVADADIIQKASELGMVFEADLTPVNEEEIIKRARELGMIYPNEIEPEDAPPAESSTQTAAPTFTPVPTPTVTPTFTPAPTPTAAPTFTPVPTPAQEVTSSDGGDYVHVSIPSGGTSRSICQMLEAAGLADNAAYFENYLIELGYAERLQTGEYDIPKDISARELADMLIGR
ncbi:MAG: hypothetical protein LBL96_07665 [Clostridiales bacterium]|jgi:hypothetical protein|nr:hypothetical protein [Clostridiales bacterium]